MNVELTKQEVAVILELTLASAIQSPLVKGVTEKLTPFLLSESAGPFILTEDRPILSGRHAPGQA